MSPGPQPEGAIRLTGLNPLAPRGRLRAGRSAEALLAGFLYVMLGSALGGGARFLVSNWVQARAEVPFPIGTLLVNVTGSFLLGFLLELPVVGSTLGPQSQRFLTTGLCGGYTTFSTFSAENSALIRGGAWGRASAYVALSVGASIAAVFAGAAVARTLFAARGRP